MNTDAIPVLREFRGEADLDPLIALLEAVAEHDKDGMEVSIDEIRFEWISVEPGWIRDLRVWEVEGRFVASVGALHAVEDEKRRVYLWHDVHPDWREPAFVDETTRVACDASSKLVNGSGAMRSVTGPHQEWKRSSLERAGFAHVRNFNRMSAPIAEAIIVPELPDGFQIRPLDPATEVEAWVSAANAGFADHFEPHQMTADEKRHRMTEPGYLPEIDLVLVRDAHQIVGIGTNSTETMANGDKRGWVHLLALLPEYRGRGLGRALLLCSMAGLRQAGFDRAYLGVDSGNESGALKLYTSVGFQLESQFLLYARDIDRDNGA
jgi:mycothiol synthase